MGSGIPALLRRLAAKGQKGVPPDNLINNLIIPGTPAGADEQPPLIDFGMNPRADTSMNMPPLLRGAQMESNGPNLIDAANQTSQRIGNAANTAMAGAEDKQRQTQLLLQLLQRLAARGKR